MAWLSAQDFLNLLSAPHARTSVKNALADVSHAFLAAGSMRGSS